MIDGGCEPYSMDFGEEFVRWLERNLTTDELAERARRWQAYRRVDPFLTWQFGHSLLRLRAAFAARALLWPWRAWRLRRVREMDALAESRGGPAPGPTWKVRHEWGVTG